MNHMKPPADGRRLFTEYEIISLAKGKKHDYLEFLHSKISQIYTAKFDWKGTEENPALRVEFDSVSDFLNAYARLNKIFDKISSLIVSGEIDFSDLKFPEPKNIKSELNEVFLILKISSNWKEPLRKDFRNAIGIANFLNLSYSYEEIEDGFLIFYPTLQSFQDAQVNRLDPFELEKWFKKRKAWNEKIGEIIKKLF